MNKSLGLDLLELLIARMKNPEDSNISFVDLLQILEAIVQILKLDEKFSITVQPEIRKRSMEAIEAAMNETGKIKL